MDKLCTTLNCDIADILIMEKEDNSKSQQLDQNFVNNESLYRTISEAFFKNGDMSLDLFDIYVNEVPVIDLLKIFERLVYNLSGCSVSLVSGAEYKIFGPYKFLIKGNVMMVTKHLSDYLKAHGYYENETYSGKYKDFLLEIKEMITKTTSYEMVIFNTELLYDPNGLLVVSTILG